MPLELDQVPVVDNHCHSLLRRQPVGDEAFRSHLTESYFPEMARDHAQHSLLYRWTMVELAGLLGCEPTPEAVHAARASRGLESLTGEIVERAGFRTWLIDTGYGGDTTLSIEELRSIAPCRIEQVVRLEPLIEALILEADTFAGFLDSYRAALDNLRGRGIVGLKSVIAYRSGLQLELVDRATAAGAFKAVQVAARRDGRIRIKSKPLLDHLIVIAVEECARQEVPIQFHTGLGDPDLDLVKVDPAALRPRSSRSASGPPRSSCCTRATPTSDRWPTSPRCSRTCTPTWARRSCSRPARRPRSPASCSAWPGQQDPVQH